MNNYIGYEKKGDFMEFIKTEKGWLNLETEELTLFGDLAAALWGTLRETFDYINIITFLHIVLVLELLAAMIP